MSASDEFVILVTGANGGLGRAIARSFLEKHPQCVAWLAVFRNQEHAEELQKLFPGRVHLVSLDVTSRDDWKRAVDEVVRRSSRLDVLVNNAGRHRDGLLGSMLDDDWRSVLETNLEGVFLGCRAVLPVMIAQRTGRIVNVASLSALLAPAGQTNYAAAKAGVVALTQSLSKEVARIGITVNAVCPGYIETEALVGMEIEERKAAQQRIPMRRFGQPEEVAAAVRFLASKEAGYITGAVLKIDGGIL